MDKPTNVISRAEIAEQYLGQKKANVLPTNVTIFLDEEYANYSPIEKEKANKTTEFFEQCVKEYDGQDFCFVIGKE